LDTTEDIDIPDRIWPHQVLSAKDFHGWGNCYADSRAEPDERLKGLAYYIPEKWHLSPGCGSIVTYRLRRDGFVYLESCGGRGTTGTRMLYLKGGAVELNIQSPNGGARGQVTDVKSVRVPGYTFPECQPFSGDDTAWRPVWQEQRTLGGLEGAQALLRFAGILCR